MTDQTIGDWLKRLRARRDWTQEILAEQACCAVQTIRMIETGRRRPSREMAERLADVFEIPDTERAEFRRVARSSTESPVAPAMAEITLPYAPTPLIGRDGERVTILQLLDQGQRLISIVGPGGAGKTRLTLDIARECSGRFSGGAAWVDLIPLSTTAQIVPAISRAIGVPQSGAGSPIENLIESLAERDLLLVLDNLEHLLTEPGDQATAIVAALIAAAPGLRVLITSRERPPLAGDRTINLTGLALPERSPDPAEDAPSVQLFVARAVQADHTFVLDAANRPAVVAICRAVAGMPLAIELAAANIRMLSPAEIAAEIERELDILTTGNRSVPERQRGPRTVFEHSWRLLADAEQRALARLAIFRGGWTRAAAEAVAGAPLPILTALVDKSLVRSIRIDPATTRYAIHELVRQYAAEQLATDPAEAAETRMRHARYFAAQLDATLPLLQTAEQAAAIRRIEPDLGNVRAAWEYAVGERNLELLGAMGYPLTLIHEMRGAPREAVGLLQAGVSTVRVIRQVAGPSAPPALSALSGLLLTGYGWLQGRSGNVPAACDLLQEAVTVLAAHETLLAKSPVFGHLGLMLFQRGQLSEARTVLERGIALFAAREADFFLAISHVFLSFVAQEEGDLFEARRIAERALEYANRSGSQRARVLALAANAITANERRDTGSAMGFVQEAMAISIANRDRWGLALTLTQFGEAALMQGDLIEAGARLRESIELLEEIGEPFNLCRALLTLGDVEQAAGDSVAARRLWADALRRCRAAGIDTMTRRAERRLTALGVSPG